MTIPLMISPVLINRRLLLFGFAYVVLFVAALHTYVQWQSVNFILGAMSIPFVARVKQGSHSNRYAMPALACCLLSLWLPVSTILYFAFMFLLLLLVESFAGRTNFLLLLVMGFLSPVFQYFMNVFSFPVRLQLTGWVAAIFSKLGSDTIAEGNIIHHNGQEFSVDPACMGLNMLLLSFIMGIVLLSYFQQRRAKRAGWISVMIVMSAVLLLNLVANILRIIFMVQFSIKPATMAHDTVGLVFLLAYVGLPLYFLSAWMVNKWGKPVAASISAGGINNSRKAVFIHLFFTALIAACCFRNISIEKNSYYELPDGVKISGYNLHSLPGSIIKLENEQVLVYIKRIAAFYTADHAPYICWSGSGYAFSYVKKENIAGVDVYSGTLIKGDERLYTCWWYQHDIEHTTNQFRWRWQMLKRKGNYSVVNVTAASREKLEEEVAIITRDQPFRQLLQ